MLPFDDKRWNHLTGGYKTSFDPRPCLQRIESQQDTAAAWQELWEELHHQGDVGDASYAAVPELVRIHRTERAADWNLYAMVAIIELARTESKNPQLPDWLREDFLGKIIDLGKTKNGDQRMITMTEHVFRVLVRCVHGKQADDFVFTREDGSPVKDFRGAWWNACIRAGLGRFQCRDCQQTVTASDRKCSHCNSNRKAKYIGLRFHDLRRTGIRNMSRKGIPENVGMLISGHRTNSVYRRYNIIDMDVIKEATAKIEEHQRALKPENSHRTATATDETAANDKTDPVN